MMIYVRKIFNCKVLFKYRCQGAPSLLKKNFKHSCNQVLSEWRFWKKITITATEVVLIQLFSLTVVSKTKQKMKTRNTTAPSYHSKVTSIQNKGISFSSCLFHGMYCYISMFGLSQSFSDNSILIILADIQRWHENGKWVLCVYNGLYALFKRSFLVAPHCFIKLFHLRQSYSILGNLWRNKYFNA